MRFRSLLVVFCALALSLPLIGCATAPDAGGEASGSGGSGNSWNAADLAPTGFAAKSLPEIADALRNGEISSESLVKTYLDRIERIDRSGPTLRAVLALNPNALDDARAADARKAAGEELGALHGVPILLKDNIESKDPVPTTAGSLALADNLTERDAPLVAGLRDAGAVILGKTNLTQWANYRSFGALSGWSSLGGQVRNPHLLDRNPCGSSSGSGAAMAASLAAGAVGTETNGSIICPSNVNGIVGFKPTVGLVSQQYIVPISSSQDTAGPMTKTVRGAALMLTAMATGEAKTDYAAALDAESLDGLRIGVMRLNQGRNPDILDRFDAALADLETAGATLVDIDTFDFEPGFSAASRTLMNFEFKTTINEYLADAAPAVATRTLTDLIAFNEANADVELALFGQTIFEAANELGELDDPKYLAARELAQRATRGALDAMLADNDVDILVSPSGPLTPRVDPINGDVWPAWSGGGSLAAIAGYPHLTVPMGTVHAVPLGLSFFGAKDDDARVLSVGYAYEQATRHRVDPGYLADAEARPEIRKAMRPAARP